MKYTAEEVRARLGFVISDREPRILTWESGGCRQTSMAECALWDALAECIKADEGAAQVDQVGELLAIIHRDGGHYQAEHGLQKAAKDAQEKVIQMMTKIATAEPVAQSADSGRVPDGWVLVAQGEASLGRCIACGRATDSACDGLNGAGLGCMIAMPRGRAVMTMTLKQVRDWHRREAYAATEATLFSEHQAMADAIDAHLTQPAQSVDIGAIREVIEDMECSSLSAEWTQPDRWAERLAAALQEKGNG